MPGNSDEHSKKDEKKETQSPISSPPPAPITTGPVAPPSEQVSKYDGMNEPDTQKETEFSGYGDVINYYEKYLKENPLETPEQKKKRERMEKWEGIVSGISDAVSAASNLYFTSQYAPNMYDHRSNLSDKAKERWDKGKADRDALLKQHLNYALKIGQLKDADRNWRRQLEQDKIKAAQRAHDNAIADAKEKRAAQLHDLDILFRNNKIDGAKADAKRKEIEAQYADELNKAKVNREQAAANANQSRANYYDRGGSGGKQGEYPWYDKEGNLHYARDYGAMRQNAIMHGTWVEEEDKSTVENSTSFDKGKKTETNTTTKKKGEGRSRKPLGLNWGTSSSSNNETDW